MSRRLKGFYLVGFIVVLVAALAFNGCSDNSILGPETDPNSGFEKIVPFAQPADMESDCVETEGMISALEGGVMPIVRGEFEHRFSVPAQGLKEDVLITIDSYLTVCEGRDAIVFEFGPDGLVFDRAATLDFNMAELNPEAETARLFYFYPQYQAWVLQGMRPVRNGRVAFDIHHFSKYAISD